MATIESHKILFIFPLKYFIDETFSLFANLVHLSGYSTYSTYISIMVSIIIKSQAILKAFF
jgi:hypothetical protein